MSKRKLFVSKANQQSTLINAKRFERNGLKIEISCEVDAQNDFRKNCFKLVEENMSSLYKSNNIGWDGEVKKKDLNAKWARFLIAKNEANDEIAGFVMFRFDIDYDEAVVYCYELQISEKYQGNGIGEFLLKTLEEIAKAWRMEKVILTALTNNERALKFYRNLNYTADKSNPIDEKSYVILSKYV